MKNILSNRLSIFRYLIGAAGGLALTAAFPKIGIAGAAWIGPGLLLFSALGAGPGQAFRLGFAGGMIHFLGSLYWLLLIPYTFCGIPLGPAAGWLSLSAYSALFPAFWVWLCWKSFPASISLDKPPQTAIDIFISTKWWQRAAWSLGCAVAWTGLEVLRGWLFTGFPWNFLGASQYRLLPLIQIASITGIFGVSFLVVWVSTGLASAGLMLVRIPSRRGALAGELFLPLLAAASVISFGASRLFSVHPAHADLKVALVQPSIPQTLIWDPAEAGNRFKTVLDLSEQALVHRPDLLVWPESAFPGFTQENEAALARLLEKHRVPLILCADAVERGDSPETSRYYNASFLFSPEGKLLSHYYKRRLVIFGEYIPLIKWLPFLKWFTPIDGGFTPGPGPVQFQMGKATASVLICFEDMFPQEARLHALPETDFLINLTNDGWFGEGAEQWQQAASALFRAVENGLPLVRCTNNGLTCWIDAQGRIRKMGTETGSIYGPGFSIVQIPLASRQRTQTFYNRHGDLFGWSCSASTLGLIGFTLFRKRLSV